ncbi:hypothetical protein CCACVL1_15680 [Corchorus capsularis]|uniref:Uncharacterized protein n=1 Tax=Corchorus capsularis TaxID=210143 RepID=A0A1R3I1I1_COCAP|nr:hypothetical protein CCACVL1_15680 [Corchorus capsularis]
MAKIKIEISNKSCRQQKAKVTAESVESSSHDEGNKEKKQI